MFGQRGQDPRTYWNIDLGHFAHLRPADLADLTPEQLLHAAQVIQRMNGG